MLGEVVAEIINAGGRAAFRGQTQTQKLNPALAAQTVKAQHVDGFDECQRKGLKAGMA